MGTTMKSGLVGEFETPEAIIRAARELVKLGYKKLDGFTPYPLAELERAIFRRRSRITWVVFPLAILGGTSAYLTQWWTSAVDYQLNAGGRPAHAPLAFVPITFEMVVLFAALTAVITLAVWSGLPRLWQPILEVPGFERASIDRFFLAIAADDPAFDREASARRLEELGAVRVEAFGQSEASGAPDAHAAEEGGQP